jgi:hypothetical protein
MSIDGKESRSSTLSEVILAFEEEMNRELVISSNSDTDSVESFEENFPPLNSGIKKTSSTPKTIPVGKIEKVESKNTKNMKSYVCKSIEDGVVCPYGKKCKFAHNASELETKKCIYGDNCNRIKIKKGNVVNVEEKNPCIFIHPSENISNFLDRRGIIGLPLEDVTEPSLYRCTRMCVSYTNGIKCLKGTECTYAHTVHELRTTKCNFGENCHNVRKNSNLYINKGEKVCVFLHPDETLDNYYNRALKKNDKEKVEIVLESDEENVIENEDSDKTENIDTVEAVEENKYLESSEEEEPIDYTETNDYVESEEETVDSESLYSEHAENNAVYEEASIIISLSKNEIGRLCELIFNSDIKARITKQ